MELYLLHTLKIQEVIMSDIEVVFNPSSIPGGKTLGYGAFKIAGVSINYSVYSSPYNLGINVSLPSHRSMKDGQPVMKDGKAVYVNDVYIADWALKTKLEEAVVNAMYNKGIIVPPGIPYPSKGQTPFPTSAPVVRFTPPVIPEPVEAQRPIYDEELPF
jgi:hypothetical protein